MQDSTSFYEALGKMRKKGKEETEESPVISVLEEGPL